MPPRCRSSTNIAYGIKHYEGLAPTWPCAGGAAPPAALVGRGGRQGLAPDCPGGQQQQPVHRSRWRLAREIPVDEDPVPTPSPPARSSSWCEELSSATPSLPSSRNNMQQAARLHLTPSRPSCCIRAELVESGATGDAVSRGVQATADRRLSFTGHASAERRGRGSGKRQVSTARGTNSVPASQSTGLQARARDVPRPHPAIPEHRQGTTRNIGHEHNQQEPRRELSAPHRRNRAHGPSPPSSWPAQPDATRLRERRAVRA